MNGHVFQLFHKRESKQQFGKTVETMYEYVVKEFDHASDLALLFQEFEQPELPEPSEEPKKASTARMKVWEKRLRDLQSERRLWKKT